MQCMHECMCRWTHYQNVKKARRIMMEKQSVSCRGPYFPSSWNLRLPLLADDDSLRILPILSEIRLELVPGLQKQESTYQDYLPSFERCNLQNFQFHAFVQGIDFAYCKQTPCEAPNNADDPKTWCDIVPGSCLSHATNLEI